MLDELIRELPSLGYFTLYDPSPELIWKVRLEAVKPNPRRLFIAEHNGITRSDYRGRYVIIIDTIRDGYQQMTSYCRYVQNTSMCNHDLVRCLQRNDSIKQNWYRWAGKGSEDEDTYIDLPLSSAHPHLSAAVFKSIFPTATIRLKRYNVWNSACPENKLLRDVYSKLYSELDRQVVMLKRRMLTIAGYPYRLHAHTHVHSIDDLLDAANTIEGSRITSQTPSPVPSPVRGFSWRHYQIFSFHTRWAMRENGTLILKPWHNPTIPSFSSIS